MAKLYLALICLFTYSLASDCTAKNSPSGAGDCEKLAVDTGYKYCCYVYTKTSLGETKNCFQFTEEEYGKIPDGVKEVKDKEGIDDYSIDCSATYLLISVWLVLIFIF